MENLKALNKEIQGEAQYRAFKLDRKTIDEEARTVWLAFSSEEEYERWFGMEFLDHSTGSIRLGRMEDGAALLVNHNTNDQVGVIEQVEIGSDRRGRALVRFGKSARAEEIWQDVLDGIRKHVSVGYFVHKMILAEEVKDGPNVYKVTDWEPFEASIVPVPADTTVGIGRSIEVETKPAQMLEKEADIMPEVKTEETQATPVVDVKAERNAVRQAEKDRIREITFLGDRHGQRDLAVEFANSDKTVDEFRAAVLEKIPEMIPVDSNQEIGLTRKEAKSFSFLRAIDALANPSDLQKQEAASFERECSAAACKKAGRDSRGIMVPVDALGRGMTAGTDADGGYLVGTDHRADEFIDVLRNKTMVASMGAKLMPNLVGKVSIPKKTGTSTAYWLDENGEPTGTLPSLGQVSLDLKTIGAYTDISRSLMLQGTPEAEAMAREDIAAVLGLGIDSAGLHGIGASNQPTGLDHVAGIGSVAGGDNGAAATYANIVQLETLVAVANADFGSTGYLTNAKVRGLLKNVFRNSTGGDTPIWEKGSGDGFGALNGYRAGVTNQVSSTLTKGSSSGVCSAIFFGNWADLIIGMWGGLDLTVDPYALSKSGGVRVIGLQSVDVAVRNAASFAVMLDCLT